MTMYRSTLVAGLVEPGLPHSFPLAFIDAVFDVLVADNFFLHEARSTVDICAAVAISRCGPVATLRSRVFKAPTCTGIRLVGRTMNGQVEIIIKPECRGAGVTRKLQLVT